MGRQPFVRYEQTVVHAVASCEPSEWSERRTEPSCPATPYCPVYSFSAVIDGDDVIKPIFISLKSNFRIHRASGRIPSSRNRVKVPVKAECASYTGLGRLPLHPAAEI